MACGAAPRSSSTASSKAQIPARFRSSARPTSISSSTVGPRKPSRSPSRPPCCCAPTGRSTRGKERLLPAPARRALLHESLHAFLEVGAAVDLAHDVVAVGQLARGLDAAHGFLGGPQRERRVRGDLFRDLAHALFNVF